jgi:ABC-type sugar transport system ATPase subunit
VSFDVRAGEILGISGLMGSGRTELLQSLFGEYGFQPSGDIEIEGKKCRIRSARDAIALGMGLVTEDRKNTGLILMHSVTHNMTLPSLPGLCNGPVVNTVSELAATLGILMLDEPTRGIDVGTKYQVYELMDRLAAAGMAIIMASSELPEVLGMSDRVLVMHEGAMAGIVDSSEATPERIMSLATMGACASSVGA